MRILNKRQLANVPTVDQDNLFLGEINDMVQARRDLHASEMRAMERRQMLRLAQAEAIRREQDRLRDLRAAKHEEMLKRSLRNGGHDVYRAAIRQGNGYVKQFGMSQPLAGFVDAEYVPDFSASDVIPAQEFSNKLSNKSVAAYTRFKDFPLVIDAPKGDFGGILTNEKGSADFSTWIVNDAPRDFGYAPRRRRRR